MSKESYNQLLHNCVTSAYKKATPNIEKKINDQGKTIANKYDILDRIQKNGNDNSFITLKDHKPNFEEILLHDWSTLKKMK